MFIFSSLPPAFFATLQEEEEDALASGGGRLRFDPLHPRRAGRGRLADRARDRQLVPVSEIFVELVDSKIKVNVKNFFLLYFSVEEKLF
jgi:hypothetical protein